MFMFRAIFCETCTTFKSYFHKAFVFCKFSLTTDACVVLTFCFQQIRRFASNLEITTVKSCVPYVAFMLLNLPLPTAISI